MTLKARHLHTLIAKVYEAKLESLSFKLTAPKANSKTASNSELYRVSSSNIEATPNACNSPKTNTETCYGNTISNEAPKIAAHPANSFVEKRCRIEFN